MNPFEPRRVHYMDIDDRVVVDKELFLAGLEGSIRYNSNPRFQYTQNEMWLKVLRLAPRCSGTGCSMAGHWISWSPTARRPASTTDPTGLTWVSTAFCG